MSDQYLVTTPYDYQFKTMGWMIEREEEVGNTEAYPLTPDYMLWPGAKSDLMFDYLNRKIYSSKRAASLSSVSNRSITSEGVVCSVFSFFLFFSIRSSSR